jgi:pyridoxal phosphate enzyme (YggS family)
MVDERRTIAENLARVRDRMSAAAMRARRSPDDIRLVGVTKYADEAAAAQLYAAGCKDLGESRPQELWNKAADPRLGGATWHLVGHLQRNKVRRTLPVVTLIHSVDSERLFAAIDEEAASTSHISDVLLEINCSGETAKHGLTLDAARRVAEQFDQFPHVRVRGVMTMARLEGGAAAAARDFAKLRLIRDQLQAICPSDVTLNELSMGMSGDFEAAIAEGATIVRIGSALFEGASLSP